MTKKLIFASLIASCFIISCADDNNEINEIETSVSKQGISNKNSSNTNISFPVFLRTGELSVDNPDVSSSITVNPNYEYYSDYNVYAGDGYYSEPTPNCLGDGKPCINLSHFLAMKGAGVSPTAGNDLGKQVIYFAENGFFQFQNYRPKYIELYETSFTVGETGSSVLFNYGNYMSNDAANSILHYFKDQMSTIPNNYLGVKPKIRALHFQYDAWLSIPAYRRVKMSVKYSYK